MSFKKYLTEQEVNKKEEDNDKIMGAIIDYFSTHEKPDDKEIHSMAEQFGIDPDEMENKVYSLLIDLFNAGKFKESPIEPDEAELKKGIEYELDTHTNSKAIARKLALDNLVNDEHFYTNIGGK